MSFYASFFFFFKTPSNLGYDIVAEREGAEMRVFADLVSYGPTEGPKISGVLSPTTLEPLLASLFYVR